MKNTKKHSPSEKFELIAIGCSAGGIESLKKILPLLPADFGTSIVIIQHRGSGSPQILPQFFSQICPLPVREPDDKEQIQKNVVYLAPINYHLMMSDDRSFSLSVDEAVHHSRPSIDVFFETAAAVYRDKMVGLVLSGANADGAAGLLKIKELGGLAIVQDPKTASSPEMPAAAILKADPQLIMNINEIGSYLCDL